MNLRDNSWVEKYRPTDLKHVVTPERISKVFKDGIDTNYLFYGTAGIGKTTLAKALINTFGYSHLYIDGSTSRGIDTIRDRIDEFGATQSIKGRGKPKIVFIDEADNLTKDAQKALRATMERNYHSTRFIFTANYPENIIDAISNSRMTKINFNFQGTEEDEYISGIAGRIKGICTREGFTLKPEAWDVLVKQNYPDLRAMIERVQQASKLTDDKIILAKHMGANAISGDETLYKIVMENYSYEHIYKAVVGNYKGKELIALNALGEPFMQYLNENGMVDKALPLALIVHKFNYEAKSGINPMVTLLACCKAVSDIFKN